MAEVSRLNKMLQSVDDVCLSVTAEFVGVVGIFKVIYVIVVVETPLGDFDNNTICLFAV